jgi:hypothetical protein
MSSSHHHLHHLPGAALPAVRCCVLHTLIHSLRSMFCVEHEIGQPQRQILFVVTPFDKFRPEPWAPREEKTSLAGLLNLEVRPLHTWRLQGADLLTKLS